MAHPWDEAEGSELDEAFDSDEEAQAAEQTGFLGATKDELAKMAERPGPMQDMARELLAIRAEREDKAAADKAAAAAQVALGGGEAQWDSPEFLDGLRAQVIQERATASEASLRLYRVGLEQKGFAPETVQQLMAEFRASSEMVEAWNGSVDPLASHPAYRDHVREQAEAQRAAATAANFGSRYGYGEALAEAEAGIAEALAKAGAG